MSLFPKRTAILVGGGPAPGINSVIGAATIRAILSGSEVIGIEDGFKWIMRGDISHVMPLSIESVSRIHFRGDPISVFRVTIPQKIPGIWKIPFLLCYA